MKIQKKNTIVIVLVILILLILGGFSYHVFINKNIAQSELANQVNTWKEYTSEEYNFSIQYPAMATMSDVLGQICYPNDTMVSFTDINISNGTLRIAPKGDSVFCGDVSENKTYKKIEKQVLIGNQTYMMNGYINNEANNKYEHYEVSVGQNTIYLLINQNDPYYGQITDEKYQETKNLLFDILATYKLEI